MHLLLQLGNNLKDIAENDSKIEEGRSFFSLFFSSQFSGRSSWLLINCNTTLQT